MEPRTARDQAHVIARDKVKRVQQIERCNEVRKVFSSYELSEMVLVRDALAQRGFEVTTSNEHSGFTPIPEFRPQADLWITDDADYQRARRIVAETLATLDSKAQHTPWTCVHCGEENPQSFETCWSCAREKNGNSDA